MTTLTLCCLLASTAIARADLVVYVHGGGGHITGADYDDAPSFASGSLKHAGYSATDIAPFEGTRDEWRQMMACTRRHFAGLPVAIVDRRPASGDFLMLVVGGTAADVGKSDIWGWASTGDARVVERGVGFAFSAEHQVADRAAALCDTAAHEIGHMLGLPHSDDCRDIMSVNHGCERTTFLAPNRAILAASLAAWGTPSARSRGERVTGIVGEPSATTGLYPATRKTGDIEWQFSLDTPKPIARVQLHYVTPRDLRGHYDCTTSGKYCSFADHHLQIELWDSEHGEYQFLIEVTYTDGEQRRTPWFTSQVP